MHLVVVSCVKDAEFVNNLNVMTCDDRVFPVMTGFSVQIRAVRRRASNEGGFSCMSTCNNRHIRHLLVSLSLVFTHSGGSRICQRRDHGERAELETKGSRARRHLKLKAFCPFSYKKEAKS